MSAADRLAELERRVLALEGRTASIERTERELLEAARQWARMKQLGHYIESGCITYEPCDVVRPSPASLVRTARAFRRAALVQWQPGETIDGYTARADAFMQRLLEIQGRGRPLKARTSLGALLR